MNEDLEDLKRRLVVGRKRDGRSVYDEAAKAELVVAFTCKPAMPRHPEGQCTTFTVSIPAKQVVSSQ